MATQSSILAWEILWTEEPGGLQSMGWQRVGHDGMTEHTHKICISIIICSKRNYRINTFLKKILTQNSEETKD